MTSKKTLLRRSHLYAIVDNEQHGTWPPELLARLAIRGGADLVQFRDKHSPLDRCIGTALRIRTIARHRRIPFIMNDRVEAAIAVDADGIHIGQGDLDVASVRALVGPAKIIGVSVTDRRQAIRAAKDGADYLGFGPVFATPIKKDRARGVRALAAVQDSTALPVFAIGGITRGSIPLLKEHGCTRVAVIRALADASDPTAAARHLKRQLNHHDTIRLRTSW